VTAARNAWRAVGTGARLQERRAGPRPIPDIKSLPKRPSRPQPFLWIALFLGAFLLARGIAGRLTDWLWFREIGFERVFLLKILAQWSMGGLAGLVGFAVLYGNARIAAAVARSCSSLPRAVRRGRADLRPRHRVLRLHAPHAAALAQLVTGIALALLRSWCPSTRAATSGLRNGIRVDPGVSCTPRRSSLLLFVHAIRIAFVQARPRSNGTHGLLQARA
jgi:hypothetical protein